MSTQNQELKKAEALTVSLHKVRIKEKDTLKNLMTLYLHELSEYADDLEPTEEGLFEYSGLDLYWKHESLLAFFVKVNGSLAGFVFLNRHPYAPKDVDFNLSEFFILKRYRGTGVAEVAIIRLFKLFPGKYNVAQLTTNTRAVKFWHKLYEDNNIEYEEWARVVDGFDSLVQKFTV